MSELKQWMLEGKYVHILECRLHFYIVTMGCFHPSCIICIANDFAKDAKRNTLCDELKHKNCFCAGVFDPRGVLLTLPVIPIVQTAKAIFDRNAIYQCVINHFSAGDPQDQLITRIYERLQFCETCVVFQDRGQQYIVYLDDHDTVNITDNVEFMISHMIVRKLLDSHSACTMRVIIDDFIAHIRSVWDMDTSATYNGRAYCVHKRVREWIDYTYDHISIGRILQCFEMVNENIDVIQAHAKH